MYTASASGSIGRGCRTGQPRHCASELHWQWAGNFGHRTDAPTQWLAPTRSGDSELPLLKRLDSGPGST